MKKLFYIILILFIAAIGSGKNSTSLENKLAQDIEDYSLDDFDHIDAAFILSGANSSDSLTYYRDWYDQLLQTIEAFNFDAHDRKASASKVFSYLHSSWLITYKEEATTLLDVVKKKTL